MYASALGGYGVAVWNDVRFGDVCPAVNTWRAAIQVDPSTCPTGRPAVQRDCGAGTSFGNTDIFGYTSGP